MRKLDAFENDAAARRFAAAVGGRGIATEVTPEADGSATVWVIEENRLPAAREELVAFRAEPGSSRFDPPPAPPKPKADRHQVVQVRRRWERPVWQRVPVTVGLIVASVLIAAATGLGGDRTGLQATLSIASYRIEGDQGYWYPAEGLSDVRSGEVWRLVTPMFLHFGPFHLLFNMMWLWTLGSAIEMLRGSARLLLAVVTIAAISNLAEYWLDFGFDFNASEGFRGNFGIKPSPFFGGMSGVVFGLFGLIWMRSALFRGSGFTMPRDLVVWMLMFGLLAATGLIGPVANVAHFGGLAVGMAIGAAPRLWRRA